MELGRWTLSHEFVRDYLSAVGDDLPAYDRHGLVPPMALAARALGVLLERLSLPPGAIHSLQEIAVTRPVPFGGEIAGTADVSQHKRRGGLEFITATMSLHDSEGREALRSKSMVLVTDHALVPSRGKDTAREKDPEEAHTGPNSSNITASPSSRKSPLSPFTKGGNGGILPVVAKTITQEQLNAYARVSGDQNPLHLDAGFAATTQFGGIVAHGMLTLAFISEMLTAKFEKSWLQTGALRVRFKGAAYVGDTVEAIGRVDKEEPDLQDSSMRRLGCTIGVKNRRNGQELISGNATLVV